MTGRRPTATQGHIKPERFSGARSDQPRPPRPISVRVANLGRDGIDASARPLRPRGFTLVEALVAITITALAGGTLLLGITASVGTSDDAERRTIAHGLAEQALDEVLGARYMELGCSPYDTYLQPGGSEKATGTRELYDDIDDYNGWTSSPPVDRWGVELGTDDGQGGQRQENFRAPAGAMDRWKREIAVYYVDESDLVNPLSNGQTSDWRAVEARVYHDDPQAGLREMARVRRIVSYVEPYESD